MKRKIFVFILITALVFTGVKLFKLRLDITDKAVRTAEIPADDWRLILVNGNNAVPENYSPELMQLSNGIYIDSRIYPDLQQMFDDARNEGIYPVVSEGYRTYEQQKNMMKDKTDSFIYEGYSEEEAEKLAANWVAEAGKSEHELGLALDINADTSFCTDEEVYEWLKMPVNMALYSDTLPAVRV